MSLVVWPPEKTLASKMSAVLAHSPRRDDLSDVCHYRLIVPVH